MTTNFSPMDAIEATERAGDTLTSPESCKALLKVMDKFDKWADELILGYRAMPILSKNQEIRLVANIDTLESAKANLARIIREASTK